MAGSLWLCGFGTSEVICDVARPLAWRSCRLGTASALPELAPGTTPVERILTGLKNGAPEECGDTPVRLCNVIVAPGKPTMQIRNRRSERP
jgi:hypothetical protein